ncbi:MAG: hypothetical protein ACLGI6_08210, partial [Gammaproteobacteria bacterium]
MQGLFSFYPDRFVQFFSVFTFREQMKCLNNGGVHPNMLFTDRERKVGMNTVAQLKQFPGAAGDIELV